PPPRAVARRRPPPHTGAIRGEAAGFAARPARASPTDAGEIAMRGRDGNDRAPMTRRDLLRSTAAVTAVGALAPAGVARGEGKPQGTAVTRGRIRQSACRWCYGKMPIDELASAAKQMGLVGIDLLKPDDFEAIKRHGLVCTMTSTHP